MTGTMTTPDVTLDCTADYYVFTRRLLDAVFFAEFLRDDAATVWPDCIPSDVASELIELRRRARYFVALGERLSARLIAEGAPFVVNRTDD